MSAVCQRFFAARKYSYSRNFRDNSGPEACGSAVLYVYIRNIEPLADNDSVYQADQSAGSH
jgi:hypothetical protein